MRRMLLMIAVMMSGCGSDRVAGGAIDQQPTPRHAPGDFCALIDRMGLSGASACIQREGITDDTEIFRGMLVTYIAYAIAHDIRLIDGWQWARLAEFNAHKGDIIRQMHESRGDVKEIL